MTEEEAVAMQQDDESVDLLAEYMDRIMYRVDGDEFRAVEVVFEEHFSDVLDDFRERRMEALVEDLGLFYDAKINGETLFVDCWRGESVEIFLADDGGLMCLLPGEDEPRALREKIHDVEAGDAFFYGDGGSIRIAGENARISRWTDVEFWYVREEDGPLCYAEDFGYEIGQKMRELLQKLPEKPLEEKLAEAQKGAVGTENKGKQEKEKGLF